MISSFSFYDEKLKRCAKEIEVFEILILETAT